jgi:hypothetical protein
MDPIVKAMRMPMKGPRLTVAELFELLVGSLK